MRHDPASAALVVMLRGLKMFGMAHAVSDLVEQGAPAFEAAVPTLSQLLKAEEVHRGRDRSLDCIEQSSSGSDASGTALIGAGGRATLPCRRGYSTGMRSGEEYSLDWRRLGGSTPLGAETWSNGRGPDSWMRSS